MNDDLNVQQQDKETSAQQSYTSYHKMVHQTLESISSLAKICEELDMIQSKNALENSAEKLRDKTFSVGIMGEFKRGKSTVINALLGQNIIPSDILPTSATLNYVRWATKKGAVINFKDGRSIIIDVNDIINYVTKLTEESASVAATVEDAVVYYPCPFCQNGVQIVDTPGLNDEESMTQIVDACFLVLTDKKYVIK